ncbi:MAG TPA: hypothetical protein VMB23_06615 [Spirochaetia bacterium]|jgi:hypothetical protein|nr:hypothetical protein [Spirochaetia bacterium]
MNAVHFDSAMFAGARGEELLHEVEEHKYFTNLAIPFEISLEEAFQSWVLLVAQPLGEAMDLVSLDQAFPGTEPGQLFLQVSRHWYYKKVNGRSELPALDAVLDFGRRFAPRTFDRARFILHSAFAQE